MPSRGSARSAGPSRPGARRAPEHADRLAPSLRMGARDLASSRRSRTPSAARSTTSSSRSSPGPFAAGCARAASAPRASSFGRRSRSRSAPRTSTATWATGSPRCAAPLPVYIDDPVARLQTVCAPMDGLKQSKQALGAEVISRFNDFAPPTLLAQAARINFSTRLFNLVVTNVPGPQLPLYLLGRELQDCFPVGFLPPNQALFIAIMSYNGGINFGLLADYDSMEDVEVIAEGLRARSTSCSRLRRSASGRAAKRRRPPRRAEPEARRYSPPLESLCPVGADACRRDGAELDPRLPLQAPRRGRVSRRAAATGRSRSSLSSSAPAGTRSGSSSRSPRLGAPRGRSRSRRSPSSSPSSPVVWCC